MADTINGTGEGQPADDTIRSALAAAMTASEESSAEVKPAPEAKPDKRANGAADAGEAKHEAKADEPAEIAEPELPLDKKDEPKAAKAAAEPEKVEPDKDAEKAETEKKAVGELTGKWSAADKEAFKKLPAEGQDLILRRHKEMEAAYTRKTQDIASFRKEYEPVDKIFEPYRDRMKQGGWTAAKLVEGWANVERRLMEGDGVNVVAGLISGYRVDLGKVAQALGLRPQGAAPAATGEPPPKPAGEQPAAIQLPPEVLQELRDLRRRVDTRDQADIDAAQRARTSAEENVMTDIEKFKSAQDDKGQLLHPHFDELESDMTLLAQAAIAAKKPLALPDLYEKAVMANPSTREQWLAARDKAQRDKAAADARAKAAAAKKAGSSVTGAPGSGQAPQAARRTERSLREELEANTEDVSSQSL